MSKNPPLGFLIKSVDNALHHYVDGVLREAHGVGRGHWQALRTAQDDPNLDLEQFSAEAAAFYTAGQIDELLSSLTDNGWLRLDHTDLGTTAMRMTDAGRELLKQMSHTQARTAQILSEGVSSEDYESVSRTLAKMLANLEAATPRSAESSTAP